MAIKIQTSAGNGGLIDPLGHPTDKFGVVGTDLGFLFEGGQGKWVGGLFGDTFAQQDPLVRPTKDWRSPVMGRTSNRDFLNRGIHWDNFAGAPNSAGGRAKEIWPYARLNETGELKCFTLIPNDIIQLPNGYYMGCGFRVREWVKNDPYQAMCYTYSNAWFWSNEPNAENWQIARHANDLSRPYEWGVNEGRNKYFQNATMLMIPGDDHVYVFGSREGRKNGTGAEADGVYLRRCHWTRLTDNAAWQFWGFQDGRWQWGTGVWPTPILKPITQGASIGELNAQYIAGKVVLTWCDRTMGSVAVVADRPDAVWSAPTVLVPRTLSGAQYAPSVHPWNTNLNDSYFHLSSWAQTFNPLLGRDISVDYCAQGWRGSLVSDGISLPGLSLKSETLGLDTSTMLSSEAMDTMRTIVDASAEAQSTVLQLIN